MNAKRRRVWEWTKTVLIVLLFASALYLASLALLPNGFTGLFSRFPAPNSGSSETGTASFNDETLRPAALAVTSPEGRYALLYGQEDQERYTQMSSLLAEALTSAGAPKAIGQSAWRQCLGAPGLYWEYLGELPLGDLTRWLAGQTNSALSGFTSRRLVVTESGLYFFSDADGAAYMAPLSVDLAPALEELYAAVSPNGAQFAFESPSYHLMRLDTLLVSQAPELPYLTAADPVTVDESGTPGDDFSRLLRALSFHPQTNPLYTVTGGWALTDGSDTLRVTAQGVVSFRQSEDGEIRFPTGDDPLDVTRSLAEQTVGALGGDASLYLRDYREENGVTTVTYGYAYRGAAIQVGQEGWCAKFTLENGAVTQLLLRPRQYTALEAAPLLPQEQAIAAHTGGGRWTLALLYEDGGDGAPIAPFWAARQ